MEGRDPLVRRTNIRPDNYTRRGLISISRRTRSGTSRNDQNDLTNLGKVLVPANEISHRRVCSEMH